MYLVVPHCSFNLHLPDNSWHQASFDGLICHPYILFGESVQIFWTFYFLLLFFFLAMLNGMQDLSSPARGLRLHPLQWKCFILTTGLPRNPLSLLKLDYFLIMCWGFLFKSCMYVHVMYQVCDLQMFSYSVACLFNGVFKSAEILPCGVLVWFWYQNNSVLVKWVWKHFFSFCFLEKFENSWY